MDRWVNGWVEEQMGCNRSDHENTKNIKAQ